MTPPPCRQARTPGDSEGIDMDDTTRRLPDDQRVLGSYELQLRNLLGVQRHAQQIVEQLQGRRGFAEPIAELLSHIESSDMEAWIASVQAVRATLQRESR